GVAGRAGVRQDDILIAIDDKSFELSAEVRQYLDEHRPGEQVRYKFHRGNEAFEATLTFEQKNRLLPILSTSIGLLFLFVGFVVVYKKPWARIPRLYYFFSLTFFIILALGHRSQTQPFSSVISYLVVAGYFLWGPSILHFFMVFPAQISLLHKRPKIVYLFYLPSILGLYYAFIINPKLRLLGSIIIGLYFASSFYLLGKSRRKITTPHEQRSMRVIKYGMYFGLTPLAILAFLPDLVINLFGITAVGVVFGLMGLLPISFGYAIMRYGLMDVEIIIKKSLIYSLLTSSLVLLYLLIVMGLGGYLADKFGLGGQTGNILFLIIVALAFQPVRNGIQNFVDRRFYRRRYEYQKTLLKLSQELPGLINISDILNRVTDTISRAMYVSNVMIHLYDQKAERYILRSQSRGKKTPQISWKDEPNGLVDLIKTEKSCCLFYKIEEDERYNNLPVSDKLKIEKSGAVLTIPMFYQDALFGIIGLGPKRSGQVYNQEDMDLLQTVAGNAAVALVNARLHQEDLRKQRFESELVMARRIQEGLLPKQDPNLPGLEITGISKPASIVGGDYFDFIPMSDDQILLLVGDVSGKGMPAAIYMSKVQGMVQMAAGVHNSPKNILMNVNRRIYRGLDRKSFITMIAALVDGKQREISFSRAGHMPILVKRKNKIEFITSKGIGLGLEAGDIFDREIEEFRINLEKGDFCVLFSDGVTEAQNQQKEAYGECRLQSILENGNAATAVELKDLLLKDIQEFQSGAEQVDDVTFVIVRAV
ncbi:MAG: SpoIIE family protein phosphatase, partial [bacterium]